MAGVTECSLTAVWIAAPFQDASAGRAINFLCFFQPRCPHRAACRLANVGQVTCLNSYPRLKHQLYAAIQSALLRVQRNLVTKVDVFWLLQDSSKSKSEAKASVPLR